MRNSWLFWGVAMLAGILLGFVGLARAQEAGSSEKSLEQRFEELDQEVRIHEPIAKVLCEPGANAGLAHAHETGKDDVLEHILFTTKAQ